MAKKGLAMLLMTVCCWIVCVSASAGLRLELSSDGHGNKLSPSCTTSDRTSSKDKAATLTCSRCCTSSNDSIYQFSAVDMQGRDRNLGDHYRSKVLMIVNVASHCSLTRKSYKEMAILLDRYYASGLRILLFPCNQFMGQEPDSDSVIRGFAGSYSKRFDLFAKTTTGHPIFRFLVRRCASTLFGWPMPNAIVWNFTKFLIDRKGQPVSQHNGLVGPLALQARIQALIESKVS